MQVFVAVFESAGSEPCVELFASQALAWQAIAKDIQVRCPIDDKRTLLYCETLLKSEPTADVYQAMIESYNESKRDPHDHCLSYVLFGSGWLAIVLVHRGQSRRARRLHRPDGRVGGSSHHGSRQHDVERGDAVYPRLIPIQDQRQVSHDRDLQKQLRLPGHCDEWVLRSRA